MTLGVLAAHGIIFVDIERLLEIARLIRIEAFTADSDVAEIFFRRLPGNVLLYLGRLIEEFGRRGEHLVEQRSIDAMMLQIKESDLATGARNFGSSLCLAASIAASKCRKIDNRYRQIGNSVVGIGGCHRLYSWHIGTGFSKAVACLLAAETGSVE
nr:hypothetical protein [Salinisphaera shabanensis]